MDTKTIDFKDSSQIKRYLNEMSDYWNEHRQHMLPSKIKDMEPLEIETYTRLEAGDDKVEENRLNLIKWLEKEDGIQLVGENGDDGHKITEEDYIWYPKKIYIQVRNIVPIIELQNFFYEKKIPTGSNDNGRLIFFNEGTGQIICGSGNKRLALKTDSTKLYYKYFVSIYLSAGENGGTTVSEIRRVLRTKFKMKGSIERKDVQNHINNTIKRVLKGKTPNDFEVFSWTRNTDNVFFNNPEI